MLSECSATSDRRIGGYWQGYSLIAILVAGTMLLAVAAAAAPTAKGVWSWCDQPNATQCVADFSRNGVSVYPTADGAMVAGQALRPAVQLDSSGTLKWAVVTAAGVSLPPVLLDSYFRLTLRTGELAPGFTVATAKDFFSRQDNTSGSGYTLIVEGRPTTVNWTDVQSQPCSLADCGPQGTRADFTQVIFRGRTEDAGNWLAQDRQRFVGAYMASNAQDTSSRDSWSSPPTWPSTHWQMQLANPSLDRAGAQASGDFTLFLPASYFEAGALDAGAFTIGLWSVWQADSGSALENVAVVPLADGAYYRVRDLRYPAGSIAGGVAGAGWQLSEMVPDAPVMKSAQAMPGSALLHFQGPRFEGNAPISGYSGQCMQGELTVSVDVPANARSALVAGLDRGGAADCYVRAVNAYGPSAPSNSRTITATPARPPSPPTDARIITGQRLLTVTFAKPVFDGGAPITGYDVRCRQGTKGVRGVLLDADVYAKTFRRVRAGVEWTCSVAAINAVGQSSPTDSLRGIAAEAGKKVRKRRQMS